MQGDGTNPHASMGAGDDSKFRTDVTGNTSSTIGHHFPAMIKQAPVKGFTVHHALVFCPGCTSATRWHRSEDLPACGYCGGKLDVSGVIGDGKTPRG